MLIDMPNKEPLDVNPRVWGYCGYACNLCNY
jgi:hypothetical protein